MSNFLAKYLHSYTEAEVALLSRIPFSHYASCLVIPVFNEAPGSIDRVVSRLELSGKILLVLIANAPSGSADNTRRMVHQIRRHHTLMWEGTHLNCLLSFNSAIDLLLIDRCSQGCEIPPRRGVGLARKIGADIATQLICEGIVTDPWIYTTDADVCLPADYFDAIGERERRGAVLFPFRHKADAGSMDAAMLYELSLHYYVRALRWSGSPYAYHSIGSTLAVHFESYAMVRGFPRRAAGEDFYLLNKVAKVADIFSLPIPDIEIEARESNRTPFGTGKNLASIKSLQAPLDQYGYYHPEIFHLLRLWLARMNTVWIDRPETLAGYVSVGCTSEESGAMHGCLSALKIPQAVAKGLQQYRSAQSFGRFLHGWFDALKTLKFIHFMKDHAYPSVNLREMLAAPFMNIGGADLLDDLPRDVSRAHLHDVLQEIIERVRLSA